MDPNAPVSAKWAGRRATWRMIVINFILCLSTMDLLLLLLLLMVLSFVA